jgi:hypothetical protein
MDHQELCDYVEVRQWWLTGKQVMETRSMEVMATIPMGEAKS